MPGQEKACRHGLDCVKFQCAFVHPAGRIADCRRGGSCTRGDACRFRHPKAKDQAGGGTQNTKLVRAGGDGGNPSGGMWMNDGAGYREELSVAVARRKLCFVAAVDTSESMKGSRTDAAIKGLGTIVGIMHDEDLFGAFTFSSKPRKLHHPMPRKKVNWMKDIRMIVENNGGLTAIYDAIADGLAEMKALAKRYPDEDLVFEHLVVTDGGDNSSRMHTAESVMALVADPGLRNYNLVVIAIDCNTFAAADMRRICSSRNATYIEAADATKLQRLLAKQAERIRIVLNVDDHGSLSRIDTTTGRAGFASALKQMGRKGKSKLSGGLAQSIAGSIPGLL